MIENKKNRKVACDIINMKEPTQFSQLQMTMRDTWVNHHLVIWKIRRERMLVDQVVLEAVAVTQARP
jgi:hypothetical protein